MSTRSENHKVQRSCSVTEIKSSVSRQTLAPIIITQRERDNINKQYIKQHVKPMSRVEVVRKYQGMPCIYMDNFACNITHCTLDKCYRAHEKFKSLSPVNTDLPSKNKLFKDHGEDWFRKNRIQKVSKSHVSKDTTFKNGMEPIYRTVDSGFANKSDNKASFFTSDERESINKSIAGNISDTTSQDVITYPMEVSDAEVDGCVSEDTY